MGEYRKASPVSTEFFTNRYKIKAIVISSQFLRLLKVEKCIKGTNFPDKDLLFDHLYAVCDNRTSKDYPLFETNLLPFYNFFFYFVLFLLKFVETYTLEQICAKQIETSSRKSFFPSYRRTWSAHLFAKAFTLLFQTSEHVSSLASD